ncbi:MAG: helix-turn-helix transcriptional regulator [Oscillospiraceae bacterium]|nr:helix-turn-helix transcriptional regulator [Oscillospiraceae bacterium]
MVKNNVEIDIKTMCIEAGITQAKLANKLGVTPAYVNRVIRRKETVVNRTFTRLIEALGYDIQITYVKRYSDALHDVERKGRTL